ncbi:soluble scavenger receptor cysteine-rich domain-containing protein SSC5D-like [Gopherus flavomarginatus]|uniref:soluble scavenger receptor cysteine-rich domain-containing protein SSC5D-like n=1 Tax=Gopherus flavomarginatus TaxID=286002 RepID=UPI0021CBCBE5|nr:soluble scavenger receptor cysteine-rich domain-containing protein SSC5D-like [Gopherus flavomarginatus]
MWLPLLLLVGFLEFHYTGPFLLRLAGGPSECVGRVEINYKGRWGSVCDDEWDLTDAAVVCRQLGCGTALSAPVGAWFGEGTGPIWLNEVRCQGSEQHLRHCRHRGWRQHVCSHEEDASAVCSAHRFLPVITSEPSVQPALGDHRPPAQSTARPASTTPEHSELSQKKSDEVQQAQVQSPVLRTGAPLRLVGGPHSCAGRLEVLHGSQWGSVCDDGWGLLEGAVVCRELGCGAVQAAPGGAHFGTGTGPIWLDDVGCSGKEMSLRQCRARPWGRTNCQHDEDASVICTGGPVLRLVGGTSSCSGRLEVFHQGRWGTVCDDMWALPGAAVVCRELGCGDPLSAPRGAFFGEGSGPIWLDNVRCQGNESALSRCLAAPWGVHDCQHAEDAGVVCTDELAHVRQRFAKPMAPQPQMQKPRMQKPRTQKPRMQKPRPRPPSAAREATQAPAQVSPQAVLPAQAVTDAAMRVNRPKDGLRPERPGALGVQRLIPKNRRPRPKPLQTRTDAVQLQAPVATPTLRVRAGARTDPHMPRPPRRPGDSILTTVASATQPPSQPNSAWMDPASSTPTTTPPPGQSYSIWTSSASPTPTPPPSQPHSTWTGPASPTSTSTTTHPPGQPHSTRMYLASPTPILTSTHHPSQPQRAWTSLASPIPTTTPLSSQPHSTQMGLVSPNITHILTMTHRAQTDPSFPIPATTQSLNMPHSIWPGLAPTSPSYTTTQLPSQTHTTRMGPAPSDPTTTQPQDETHSARTAPSHPTTTQPQDETHSTRLGPALSDPTTTQPQDETHRAQMGPAPSHLTTTQPQDETHSTRMGPASSDPTTTQPQDETHSARTAPSHPTTTQPQDETHSARTAPSHPTTTQPQDETHRPWMGPAPSHPTTTQPQDETHSAQMGQAPSHPTTTQPQDETHSPRTGPAPSHPTTTQPQDKTHSARMGPAPSHPTTTQPQDETHSTWMGPAPSHPTTTQPQDETHSAWMDPAPFHPTATQPQDETHSAQMGPAPSHPITTQPQDETHRARMGPAPPHPTTAQLQNETHSTRIGPASPSQPQGELPGTRTLYASPAVNGTGCAKTPATPWLPGTPAAQTGYESPQLRELIQVVRALRGDLRALVHTQRQERPLLGAIAGSLAELAGAVQQLVVELPSQVLRGQSQPLTPAWRRQGPAPPTNSLT